MSMNQLSLSYQEQCRNALTAQQTKSLAETNHWKHVDRDQVHADWDVLYKEIAALIDTSQPGDRQIQALMQRHYDIACRFYPPTREAYIGMGLFYAENAAMKAFHNEYHPDMVTFIGDAMSVYAQETL